jgi:hypothetical protein
LSYKNFELNFTFRASIGGKAFNSYRAYYENISTFGLTNILNTWLDNTNFTGKPVYSSKYIEDASYLKLDNVSLSYILPLNNRFISNIRFVFSAQNVACITGYKGVDPEVALATFTPGIESASYYPSTRYFTFGINIAY